MDEINQTWCEKIEDYLNGEMIPEERSAFETEMAGNEELSSLFKIYKTIETEMRDHEQYVESEEALKRTLRGLSDYYCKTEMPDEPPAFETETQKSIAAKGKPLIETGKVRKIKAWKWMAVAASAAGIIALSVALYLQNEKGKQGVAANNKKADTPASIPKGDTARLQENPPPQSLTENDKNKNEVDKITPINLSELYAANFRPDAAPNDKEGPLEDAFAYYENKAYKEAIVAIEHADMGPTRGLETDEKLTEFYAAYYKALSYMAEGDVSKAIPGLQNAMRIRPDNLSYIKTKWYLALAYLKTGDLKRSEELLEQISRNDYEKKYQTKAIELLNKLQSSTP